MFENVLKMSHFVKIVSLYIWLICNNTNFPRGVDHINDLLHGKRTFSFQSRLKGLYLFRTDAAGGELRLI